MKINAGLTKVREKITYVFLGIAFLGLTYPLLGISEGAKIDPGYFLNFWCPLVFNKVTFLVHFSLPKFTTLTFGGVVKLFP